MNETTPPKKKPGLRSIRQDRMRELILKAAASSFSAKGFDKVTMREISQVAGVGLPTLYQYFKDKEALYRTSVLYLQSLEGNTFYSGLDEIRSIEDFPQWIEVLLTVSLEDKDFARLLNREMLSDKHEIIDAMAAAFRPFYDKLSGKLNMVRAGSGDSVLPMLIIASVLGFVMIYPFRERMTDYAPSLPRADLKTAERKAIVDHLFQLIQTVAAPAGEASGSQDALEEEVKWLRNAVLELTLDKMKLRSMLNVPEAKAVLPQARPSDSTEP